MGTIQAIISLEHSGNNRPLGAGLLERPEIIETSSETHLVVNNRFFACDLEQNRATVAASYTATLKHDESYHPEVMANLWQLYMNIAQLMPIAFTATDNQRAQACLDNLKLHLLT